MSLTIPLRNDLPHFEFQVELDGKTYGFEFLWNFRAEGWFLSIFDADGAAIARNIRLVVDFPLGTRIKDSRMPPGTLMAQDSTGAHQDPGLEDLGGRTLLLYFGETELTG